MKVVVHVDGGARGNPGPAAAAAVVSTPDGEVLDEAHELLGVVTNNVAEYRGLLLGLDRARALGADEVEVVNDSELIAKQVNGEYKVKHPDMKPLHAAAREALGALRALARAQRAARPERGRRRARQPGARRGAVALRVPPAPADNPGMSPVPLPAAPATPGLTPPSSRGRSSQQIGDIVVGFGYAGRESVELAITEARAGGRRTGEVLVDRGVLTPDQLARVIAERFGVDHVDLNAFRVDMSAANLLPAAAAKRYSAVPVGFLDERTLLVAMVDPGNVLAIDDISLMTGHEIRPAVAAQEDVGALIGRLNQIDDMVVEEAVTRRGARGRRPARVRRRRAGRQARQLARRAGRRPGRLRHPLRARRRRARRPLPRRRRAGRGDAHPAPPGRGRHLAHQDHVRARHRRAARPAGRPHRAERRRPPHRRPRRDAAARRRRGRRDARPRQGRHGRRARPPRHGRPGALPLRRGLLARPRRGARHRPDRLGQDDDALRRADPAPHAREEHHHDRGPGRVRARRRQADADQPEGGPARSPTACAR